MVFYFIIRSLTLKLWNPTYHKEINTKKIRAKIIVMHFKKTVTHLIDGSKENVEEECLSNYHTPESKKMEE